MSCSGPLPTCPVTPCRTPYWDPVVKGAFDLAASSCWSRCHMFICCCWPGCICCCGYWLICCWGQPLFDTGLCDSGLDGGWEFSSDEYACCNIASSASKCTSCSESEVVDWSWSELIVFPEAAGELGMKEKSPLSECSGDEGIKPKLWFGELKQDESPETDSSVWLTSNPASVWNLLFILCCWCGFIELNIFGSSVWFSFIFFCLPKKVFSLTK